MYLLVVEQNGCHINTIHSNIGQLSSGKIDQGRENVDST